MDFDYSVFEGANEPVKVVKAEVADNVFGLFEVDDDEPEYLVDCN